MMRLANVDTSAMQYDAMRGLPRSLGSLEGLFHFWHPDVLDDEHSTNKNV